MTKKIKKTYRILNKKIRTFEGADISKSLGVFLAFSFIGYMYLVGMAGYNTISRTENQKEIKALKTEVSSLELSYIDITKDYTLSRATEYGYKETKNISFAKRDKGVAYVPQSSYGLQ